MEPKRSDLDGLVREHLPAALRFATRLARDPDLGEEIVQEALLRVARSWTRFRAESMFRTWLFRIVINCANDQASRNRRREALPDDMVDARHGDPAAAAAAGELDEIIADLVARLPDRQRTVFVLSTIEKFAPAEIAQILDVSQGNVRVNLHLARERLRQQLAPYLAEEK